MMRLDKFLVAMEVGSRSQVKNLIKKGLISIDGTVCKDADYKFDEINSKVCYMGQHLQYTEFVYYMLHKPAGVVTATQDNHDKTVMDLLINVNKKDLFPVGRLDKDTEGLLLITNDGSLAHTLLSPKKHVDKTYLVKLRDDISSQAITQLEQGVNIGEEKDTLPAKIEVLNTKTIKLIIHEGKFHQVKRMLQAVNNEVIYLKRISFGSLVLDEKLQPGSFRPLTEQEIISLHTDAE